MESSSDEEFSNHFFDNLSYSERRGLSRGIPKKFSRDPAEVPASTYQDLISRHWGVENCLHWQKDRYFEEDKHVVRSDLGKVWTVLTNVALSLCRLLSNGERTLREVREKCNADPTEIAERLGFQP